MKEKHEQSSSVTTATNELKLSPETSDVDNSEDVSNNSYFFKLYLMKLNRGLDSKLEIRASSIV